MIDNKSRLNFLPLSVQNFEFKVWRREYGRERKEGFYSNLYRNTLPVIDDVNARNDYWISFEPMENFEEFVCKPHYNHKLTQYYLFYVLKLKLDTSLRPNEYIISKKRFRKRIYLILNELELGKETVWLEPYYLKPVKKFGFLIDFKFLKKREIPFSREIQRLSLSLDKNYRSNRNFYLDKYQKMIKGLKILKDKIFPILTNLNHELHIAESLEDLPFELLKTKLYIFKNEKTDVSQYRGLEKYGPLENIEKAVKLYFIYRKKDSPLAEYLKDGLMGKLKYIRFPGLQHMFGISGIYIEEYALEKYEKDNLLKIINYLSKEKQNTAIIPIIILEKDTDDDIYYFMKYELLKRELPLQAVTSQLLRNKEAFKWSISNIALQIFAKLGGKPWKVKPSTEKSIILGLGQAHLKEDNIIKKYFAYSICTDSSGLYKKIGVLGTSNVEDDYLSQLKKNIINLIEEFVLEGYKSIVIHAPFRMRKNELESIYNSLKDYVERKGILDNLELLVLRINFKNKYFGYAYTNSLVPYESTSVRISNNPSAYLVWFEGLQYHRESITKMISGPIFIEFYWSNKKLTKNDEIRYLQDVLNLSGANWRGFNAKNLPISIYYSQIIARFLKKFPHELENISKINNPWFL